MIDFGFGVELRTFDFSVIHRHWRNDPAVWRWTRQNDLITYLSHKAWFDKQDAAHDIKMYSVWTHAKDGSIAKEVGVCGLTSIDMTNRRAEFSLYIAAQFQGNGYSKPALKSLFAHGFQNLNLNIIWGETFEDNPARLIFKDIGMREEGRRRQFYWKDGQYLDALLFSMTREEFLEEHGAVSCFP